MDIHTIGAFWVVSFLFLITPGADWAYAITAGLHSKAIAPAVTGMLCGHLVHTAIVAVGVGALIAQVPSALTALTAIGSLYLVWLGVMTLRRPGPVEVGANATPDSWWHWAGKGLGVSGLNPKVFLLFLALLPQFISPDALWPAPVQILALGAVHLVTCTAIYCAVGLMARKLLAARPTAARNVSRVSGALMILIGVILLIERVGLQVFA